MSSFGDSPYDEQEQRPPQRQQRPPQQSGGQSGGPAASFKYPAGRGAQIEVAVWENTGQGQNGEYTTYSVTIQRSYYDAQSKEWKHAKGFRTTDLPVIACAAQHAFQQIVEKG